MMVNKDIIIVFITKYLLYVFNDFFLSNPGIQENNNISVSEINKSTSPVKNFKATGATHHDITANIGFNRHILDYKKIKLTYD